MQQNQYKLMNDIQFTHWWYRGRSRIIKNLLSKYYRFGKRELDILEIGCGTGANFPLLVNFGKVTGLEPDPYCILMLQKNYMNHYRIIKVKQWKYPYPIRLPKYDLIVLTDVLEHIEDDFGMTEFIYNHLKPGGMVLITVPAHQYFWSQMDDVMHHYRRYSKRDFLRLGSGFKVEKFSFYNAFLFPIKFLFVWAVKLLKLTKKNDPSRSYNDVPPWIVNQIFIGILYLEAKIIPYVSLPFGVSIVAVLKKK